MMNKPTPDTDALIERQKSLDLRLPEGVSWTSKANCLLREMAKALSEAHSRIDVLHDQTDNHLIPKARDQAAEIDRLKGQWHRVMTLTDNGCMEIPCAEYPIDGEWILLEIESATGIKYKAEQHDRRHWNSFGTRWKYCCPPSTEEPNG